MPWRTGVDGGGSVLLARLCVGGVRSRKGWSNRVGWKAGRLRCGAEQPACTIATFGIDRDSGMLRKRAAGGGGAID